MTARPRRPDRRPDADPDAQGPVLGVGGLPPSTSAACRSWTGARPINSVHEASAFAASPATASTRTRVAGLRPIRCSARERSGASALWLMASSTGAGSPSRGPGGACRSRTIAAAAAKRSPTMLSRASAGPERPAAPRRRRRSSTHGVRRAPAEQSSTVGGILHRPLGEPDVAEDTGQHCHRPAVSVGAARCPRSTGRSPVRRHLDRQRRGRGTGLAGPAQGRVEVDRPGTRRRPPTSTRSPRCRGRRWSGSRLPAAGRRWRRRRRAAPPEKTQASAAVSSASNAATLRMISLSWAVLGARAVGLVDVQQVLRHGPLSRAPICPAPAVTPNTGGICPDRQPPRRILLRSPCSSPLRRPATGPGASGRNRHRSAGPAAARVRAGHPHELAQPAQVLRLAGGAMGPVRRPAAGPASRRPPPRLAERSRQHAQRRVSRAPPWSGAGTLPAPGPRHRSAGSSPTGRPRSAARAAPRWPGSSSFWKQVTWSCRRRISG